MAATPASFVADGRQQVGTLKMRWHILGTTGVLKISVNLGRKALNWGFDGGRGRYRTADRWCVKPELYH
jgi:hypothetical protein